MQKLFKIKSFAKINISLNIIKKLKTKFHKIESLITFLKLHDVIYIKNIKSKKHKIIFQGKFSKGIKKKNSISQLLEIIDQKKLAQNKKFEIKIIKNIPLKSGMGGGSMNAASLLNFFLKKKIFKLNNLEIINICQSIGSDVILGINFQNTILSSNNKIARFKKKLNLYVLIVKPNFGCNTRSIYSRVNKFSRSKYNKPSIKLFDLENMKKSKNDLEPIAFKKYPKLKMIKFSLINFPNVIFTRMTGSGSSILGYFKTKRACAAAYKQLRKEYKNCWCIVSKTI